MTSEDFRQARLRLGLRQRVLGVLMGMMPQSINKIERGRREPTGIQAAFIRYMLAHPPDDADVAREAAIMGQDASPPPDCTE